MKYSKAELEKTISIDNDENGYWVCVTGSVTDFSGRSDDTFGPFESLAQAAEFKRDHILASIEP